MGLSERRGVTKRRDTGKRRKAAKGQAGWSALTTEHLHENHDRAQSRKSGDGTRRRMGRDRETGREHRARGPAGRGRGRDVRETRWGGGITLARRVSTASSARRCIASERSSALQASTSVYACGPTSNPSLLLIDDSLSSTCPSSLLSPSRNLAAPPPTRSIFAATATFSLSFLSGIKKFAFLFDAFPLSPPPRSALPRTFAPCFPCFVSPASHGFPCADCRVCVACRSALASFFSSERMTLDQDDELRTGKCAWLQ